MSVNHKLRLEKENENEKGKYHGSSMRKINDVAKRKERSKQPSAEHFWKQMDKGS